LATIYVLATGDDFEIPGKWEEWDLS
jgi:hypothetical protein